MEEGWCSKVFGWRRGGVVRVWVEERGGGGERWGCGVVGKPIEPGAKGKVVPEKRLTMKPIVLADLHNGICRPETHESLRGQTT